ncbi:DUF1289 domain-containing protein [Catenovulum sediminis]|uniref:DUF1289 domain-containing protein n=1 Tax=Catenovulum sediminis TaxID=1740262 RepID=A0ABV1RJT4_9ALTE|nr:DUF1289 domain-containing protein [Catenovulum sediminis]
MTDKDLWGQHVANPCIGYCVLNDQNVCEGCGRTRDERTDWIFMSDDDKRKVLVSAEKRMEEIKKKNSQLPN